MNAILEQVNSAGLWFVEFTLPMLVQSSLLILILLLADFALREKMRAVFRYWIWLLVLLKLLLPTSLSSPLSLGYFFGEGLAYVDIAQTTEEPHVIVVDPTSASVPPFIDLTNIETYRHTSTVPPIIPDTEPAVTEPINSPVVSVTPVTWQGAVFLVWLAVVMAMGLLLLQRAIFVRGLVAQAKEANGFMTDTLESCRRSMGVKRKLGLKVSANATSPAVCGLFRPVILVPQNLTSSLSKSQLRAVLLHELAHIRRGDLWVNLAQTFLQIIYFYNPLLWVANCVIRRVREQAVDEMVLVAMGEAARQYPQTLVNVAKMAFKRPALSLRLIGVVESKNALAGRIKHILNRPMPKRAKLGILGLAVVIITAAILLPMATCTPGPPSLVIKGVVKDAQTDKPIAGARIFDDGYGPEPDWEQIKADVRSEWGAITNSAGEYSFLTWPEHHSIKVEAPGYRSERRSLYDGHFVFNKKDEETFDFALEPEKATDSSEFKTELPNDVTAELPMARAQKPEFAGRGGPLDIRLAGVRPDGSDDIYDGNGNKIADNTFANVAKRWGEDKQHRTFIFELPKTKEPILFTPFLKIKPTGAKHGFGTSQSSLLYYSGDKLTYSVAMNFPRTYKKIFERRIKKVGLTLRYYYGQRGAADFVFTGPFTPGQTVKAEGGADCELTAMKDRLDFSHYTAAFFRISSKTRFDSDSVLVYDISGRRYLPESGGGGSGNYGSNYRFRAEGLTLSSIAYVTVGEKPYEATFKNVVVSYPDRPVRDRMEFLDEMCERLDLTGLSGEDLYKYKFENPADAIKVIDIVRGRWYVMQVFDAIRYSKPRIELSNLDPQAQQKVRSAAARWAAAGHPDVRAMGIRLGLVGGWPEFLDQALEWLEQDVTVYDMGGRAYRGLEEGAKREIASEVVRYPAGLKSEQAERIKKIILRTDNPHLRVRLFTLFWRADKDLTFQTCRDLVQDDRPWIWWPAMYSLFNRCTEKLRPFGNLPEKMQKRLILVHEAGGGSSRLFGVSSSGRDYDTVAKEAYSMLPAMFTAQLARMDSDACRGVRTVMVKHLDRELATRVMTDFLREISTEPNQRLWAGDSYYFNTCCITAYHIARHINSLYDVNIANVGKFETPENSGAIPHNISRLKQLIAKTLQRYDVRDDEGLLIKFTELQEGVAKKISVGDMTKWSKSYEVEFAPGEDMLVAAEVYQAGKPMRILGRKIFARSDKPEKLTLTFVRNYKNVARTSITYNIKFQLGRQVFKIPELPIYTARYFSGEAWDWYRGEGLRTLKTRHTNEEYAGIEPLFHYCSLGRERESEDQARFWIPGSNVTPIMSNHCVVLKMIPLSRLKYLSVEPVGGYQGLDGKIIPPTNFTLEKANEIADAYKNMIGEYIVHQESNNDFTATLPNGVTVELIGICEHPSEGKKWWRPDGSLLTGPPSDKIGVGGFRTGKNEASYEIVAKLTGPETLLSRSSTPEKWEIPQARKVGLGKSGIVNDKNGVPCLRATTAIVKNGLEKIDIEFGLAGVWEKKLTISSNESSKQKIQDTGVVINPPYEKDSNATITIKIPNKIDSKMAINITAVLKNGKVIDCAAWNRNSKIRFMRSTDNYEFHGVNLSDVDHFEIYTSKYQWVKFKNVSLKPNFKTDVQVEVEGAKSEIPQPVKSSIGTARRYFSRVGVQRTRDKELVKTLREDTELFDERVGFLIRDYDDGVLHCIDFDNNRIVRVPDELDINGKDAILKWSKEHNVDALFRRASSLISLNMASTIIAEPEWSEPSTRTLEILNKRVPGSTDILYSASGEYHYYAFKTSQGRIGVLGLASLENNGPDHRLLSIKYKLLKPDVQVEGEKPQSLIFHGLDLTAVPQTTNSSRLPDLFEARPPGSKSYHIQKDVTAIYSGLDGTVYFIPGRNIFYVQHDKLGSSTLTYYGPFEGNPVQILNLQPDVQVEVDPVVVEWEDIGKAVPADFNDTISLAEHITVGSIGQDVEGKTFITLLRDREKTRNQQYRFILVRRNGTLVEPASYSTFLFGDQLSERFSFDMPYQLRQIKEFWLQRFPQNLERKASLPVVKPYDPDVNGKIAAQATSGPPGQGALHFNGKGDYLYVPDSPSLWLGPTFTVEMWIKPEFPKGELENWPSWGLMSKGCTIGTGRVKTRGFGVTLHRFNDDPNLLMIDYNTADDNGIYGKSYGRRNFDNWMHLYHVFSPDRYKPGHGYPLVVGKFLIPESPFAGQIGEIRIWRGARSREQISEYRNKPLTGDEPDLVACWTFEQSEGQIAYDISTNRNHARLGRTTDADDADPTWVNVTGGSTIDEAPGSEIDDQVLARSTVGPVGQHTLSFDGINDYLYVAANSTLTLKTPFTIEMWLKPDYSDIPRTKDSEKLWPFLSLLRKGKRLFQEERLQAGGFMMFVGPSSQTDGKCYGSLYLGNADGRLYQVGLSDGDRLQPERPGWIHVSMSCTRETYIPVSDQPLIIGENIVPSGFPFKGQIAEIRIWAGVRSGDQVARYRNKPLNGNEPGLVACWDFKRPGGQIVFDISPNGNHARLGNSEGPDDADPKWVDIKATSHQPDQKIDVQAEIKNHLFSVYGTVTDQSGRPIAGVQLTADCGHEKLERTGRAVTDRNGRYTLGLTSSIKVLHVDPYDVGIQTARIKARAEGFYEASLCREGNLAMAGKPPGPDEQRFVADYAGVVLPNKPYELNFVMYPAARIEGELVDERGNPIRRRGVWLHGDGLLKNTSLGGSANQDGKFAIDHVPCGSVWFVSVRGQLVQSRTVNLATPGTYRVQLQFGKSPSGRPTLRIAELHAPASNPAESAQPRVVDPNGNPVAGAQVALCTKDKGVVIRAGKLGSNRMGGRTTTILETDADGLFDFSDWPDDFHVIAAREKGFAWITREQFTSSPEIRLQSWGRIEGYLYIGRESAADKKMSLLNYINKNAIDQGVRYEYETDTDAGGKFVFDKVPPGWLEIGYLTRMGNSSWSQTGRTPVQINPGVTLTVAIGGRGRPVVGKFVPPSGYDRPVYFGEGLRVLNTVRPERPKPENYDRMSKRQQQQWYNQWRKTPEAGAYYDAMWHDPGRRHYVFHIKKDGSFRIEDVIAGKYQLTVWIEERHTGQGRPEEIAGYYGTIEVPEMPGGRSDEPLDLGDLELTMHNPLHVGDIAPLFEAKTLDGKDLRLIDYRGKFVLLSFWQPVFHPEKQQLQELYDTYGGNRQLEIIGLGGNDTLDEVKNYVRENAIPWPQIYTGEEFKSGIAKDYGGFGIFLIDPDGRIIAKELRGDKLKSVVSEAIEVANINKPDVQVETEKPQSLIFHGLDLTAVPHTTNFSRLPDLFEERPLGSKSYHIQKDVTAIYSGLDGTVYFIPRRNIFYVQHDKLGSSTLTYYGPFEGNPVQVLNLQPDVQVDGKSKVSELLYALRDEKYVNIRQRIIQMMEEIGNKEPLSFLSEQLKSTNRQRRCAAALALELLGDRQGVPAIIAELNDISYRPTERGKSDGREDQKGQVIQDHYYAALLLGILGDERAVPALIEATRDKTIDYQAATSLGQIGDKRAIPSLHDMLERCSNKPFSRLFAGYGLAMLGDNEGLKVVIDILNTHQEDWTIRRHAIEALGELGDKEAVPYLIAALKDEHPNIRVSTARALGAIGDLSALPALKQALEDKTETKVNAPITVSSAATKAISQIEDWGETVEGLQCRLRADKRIWKLGELPKFELDLRNVGDSNIMCAAITQNCEIEYDGQLYKWAGPIMADILSFPLRPGKEYLNAVQIKIPTSWATKKRMGVPLVLTPGRHIIRVRYRPEALAWFKSDPKKVTAISNLVEIEIPVEKPAVQVESEER